MSIMNQTSINVNPTWGDLFSGKFLLPTIITNLGILLFAVDTFIITTIMPTVIEDIGGTSLYAWPVMIFTVGAIVGAASAGPIKVKFGQRDGFIFAGLLFPAYAANIEILIAWRLLQGLGGGLIISQSFGLVGEFYPSDLRPRMFSIISTTWGLATIFGPAFGGVFAELGSWRLAFLAIVPLTLIFCVLVWRHIEHTGKGDKAEKFPVTRLVLFASGIMSIGFTSQTDDNFLRLGLLAIAIIMVSYAMKRDVTSVNPMFPKKTLVPNSAIGSSYWFNLFFTCTFILALLYSTLYLQVLHNQTPIIAAYTSATLSFCWTIGALICASWKGQKVKFAIIGGGLLMVFGAIGLVLFAVKGPIILIVLSLGIMGFGIGFSNIHVTSLTIDCAEEGDGALVASSIQTMRNLGVAFGSALAGLIANIAGLTEGVEVDVISRAVGLIHIADIIMATLSLGSLITFVIFYKKERQNH